MAFPVTAPYPQLSGTFVPEIWSGKLIENFYDATVLAAISNTDYEGEISSYGDTVNIRQTPTITLNSYSKGATLAVETPEKPILQLLIDKGEYFACIEDDVDEIQSDINLMDTWSKDASERMKIKIDQRVLVDMLPGVAATNKGATAGAISGSFNLGVTATPVAVTKTNVLDLIVDMGTVLDDTLPGLCSKTLSHTRTNVTAPFVWIDPSHKFWQDFAAPAIQIQTNSTFVTRGNGRGTRTDLVAVPLQAGGPSKPACHEAVAGDPCDRTPPVVC